ncbi:MAG: PH domain-containing protein [Candidatus Dormibacteria bacterium]
MSAQLLPGEREIFLTRQHWSIVAPAVVVTAVVAVVGIVLLRLIPGTISGHSAAEVKNAGTAVIAALAAVVILVRLLQWRAAQYLLSDRRIIVMRGVLSRFTESIALDRVQNTIVHQSIGARMIGCGDVEIESAGRDGTEMLHRIAHPQEFESDLMQAIEAHRTGAAGPGGL